MNKALVSVIIPVYNTKDYIETCINSLLCQTYPHIEIILVDDGSVDGSGELIDSLSQIYSLRVMHKKMAEQVRQETWDWMWHPGNGSSLQTAMIPIQKLS